MIKLYEKIIFLIILTLFSINVSALEKQDLISLIKPATVHILSDIKGNVVFPNIVYDFENGVISTSTKTNTFSTSTLDNSTQGSGFIISKDGIIATHSSILIGALNTVYRSETEKYLQKIDKNTPVYSKAYETIFNYLKENSIQNIEQNIKIINTKNNYEAKIIYSNYSFKNDDDIAFLKIEADNLPSVILSENDANIGQNIYSINYTSLINLVSEFIFNQGIVNAIKNKQYQTNIPSSDQSKGGPVFDDNGKIIGLLNSSGFVIPKSYIDEALATTTVKIQPSLFYQNYKSGLSFLENNRCKNALIDFDKAKNINSDFSVEEYLKPKIDKCNSIILSGLSRDTFWDEVLFTIEKYKHTNYLLFSFIIILFIFYIILYKYFVNRFRKDEEKLKLVLKKEGLEKDDDVLIDPAENKKNNIKKIKANSNKSSDFEFKTFEPIKHTILQEPDLKAKYIPPEKVEIPKKTEESPSIVTPPKAIQPEGPIVVITPFKTLNKPIKSLSNSPIETIKDIKTDLPVKKNNDIL